MIACHSEPLSIGRRGIARERIAGEVPIALATITLLALVAACSTKSSELESSPAAIANSRAASAQESARLAETERTSLILNCKANIADKKAEYRKLMKAHDYWSATLAIRQCAEGLDDPKLKALVADGEVESYVQDIENPATSDADRMRAMRYLIRDYPAYEKKYEGPLRKLTAASEDRRREQAGGDNLSTENEGGPDARKRRCAREIVDAVGRSNTRDEAEAIVRASPSARIACAGLEMNGVLVIP